MNIETLEAKIIAKAAAEVAARWETLQIAVAEAIKKFLEPSTGYFYSSAYYARHIMKDPKIVEVVKALSSSDPKINKDIWTFTENRLRDEIMSTMDTLQKVLLVKPASADTIVEGPQPLPEVPKE